MTRKIITADTTLAVIDSADAYFKDIAAPILGREPFESEYNDVGFIIRQLKAPGTFRPVITLPPEVNRARFFDFTTRTWKDRLILGSRGRAKETKFTKKISVNLLPKKGKMVAPPLVFGHMITLLFDSKACQTKDKIFFTDDFNLRGDEKFWLSQGILHENRVTAKLDVTVSVDTIREVYQNVMDRGGVVDPKKIKILARLSQDALIGLAVTRDSICDRLNAQYIRFLFLQHFNIELPLFILRSEQGIREYTAQEQQKDIQDNIIIEDLEVEDIRAVTVSEARKYQDIRLLMKQLLNFNKDFPIPAITDAIAEATSPIELLRACKQNNTERALALIQKKVPFDNHYYTENGHFLIHSIVWNQNLILLNAIIEKYGIDIVRKQSLFDPKKTPVELAFSRKNIVFIRKLIQAETDKAILEKYLVDFIISSSFSSSSASFIANKEIVLILLSKIISVESEQLLEPLNFLINLRAKDKISIVEFEQHMKTIIEIFISYCKEGVSSPSFDFKMKIPLLEKLLRAAIIFGQLPVAEFIIKTIYKTLHESIVPPNVCCTDQFFYRNERAEEKFLDIKKGLIDFDQTEFSPEMKEFVAIYATTMPLTRRMSLFGAVGTKASDMTPAHTVARP